MLCRRAVLHLPVLKSPHGILQLCCLTFCFYFSLSAVFSYESVCHALEMEEQREAANVAALVLQRDGGTISLLVSFWGPGSQLKLRVPWCDGGDVQLSELQGLQHFPW